MAPVRILHVHSTFSLGGKEARAVRLMNAFGDHATHSILSATGAMGARDAIQPGIAVDFPSDAPPIVGKPAPGRYRDLERYMRGFDLVLTYNWGAMDAVGARRLFGGTPIVHHEDGFNEDEAVRQKPARMWFRRAMLPAVHRLIVPSERLEGIARSVWRQPAGRVQRIANGIPLDPGGAIGIAGFERHTGALVIGTIAGLRAVKNLPRLVRAFAAGAPSTAQLLIMGEGPERDAIRAEGDRLGLGRRLVMPGFVAEPARAIRQCDIFALSSDSEQFPISLLEAMAAGLPAATTDVGDIRAMVATENAPFVAADERGLATAITTLCANADLRARIGAANRARAEAEYGEDRMIAAYRALYAQAIGRASPLG